MTMARPRSCAIPLWTLGGASAIVGSFALALSAYADESLFAPDLSRRHVMAWGFALIAGSAPSSYSLSL
jgi:hypothetical protein